MKSLFSSLWAILLLAILVSCEKTPVENKTAEASTPEEKTYNFRHEFTGADMDAMVEAYTGKSAMKYTEEEKMKLMGEIRVEQLQKERGLSNSAKSNLWICYAITKLKQTPTTPDNQAIFVDDADVSTTGIQYLRADAGYSESVPVNYYQLYSFSYVRNGNNIVDFDSQNFFNFTCNGPDFTFAVRSSASLFSNGGTFTKASYRCQD